MSNLRIENSHDTVMAIYTSYDPVDDPMGDDTSGECDAFFVPIQTLWMEVDGSAAIRMESGVPCTLWETPTAPDS